MAGGRGGLMCIFMPPFFPHPFVSAYQTDRDMVTELIQEQHLGARICFQKWHHCAFFFFSFLFSFSNQSNPESQLYTATQRSDLPLCVCKLGYRDGSLTGEMTEQSPALAARLLQTAVETRHRAPLYHVKVETLTWQRP